MIVGVKWIVEWDEDVAKCLVCVLDIQVTSIVRCGGGVRVRESSSLWWGKTASYCLRYQNTI